MTTRNLTVVTAGLSQPSSTRLLGERLAAATERALAEEGFETNIGVVELRDHAHALTNNMLTGFPGAELREVIDGVVAADGLIAVSPIFSASYSGLFKSFFDVLDADALAAKPTLIAATGGTERHSLALEHALRPLFAYLRAVVVPTAVYAASSDWGTGGELGSGLNDRIDRAAAELAELVSARTRPTPVDAFEQPTPFEDLLLGR